jgi:hypothetical protein
MELAYGCVQKQAVIITAQNFRVLLSEGDNFFYEAGKGDTAQKFLRSFVFSFTDMYNNSFFPLV